MADIVKKVKDEISFDKVLRVAMRMPTVKINRDKFLRKELIKYCSEQVVEEAVRNNPAKAGVSKKIIDKVSTSVINYETTKVTGLSVAASIPGGGAAVAAAAADITSYFAFIIRTVQELAYLYGFEQFDLNEDEMDSETMNYLILFMGTMFGVQGATAALRRCADAMAKRVAKKLAQKPLAKGVVYPVVKKIVTHLGGHITKQVFADSVASTIPLLGGALSGGLTYAMFKPGCVKLKKTLMTYNLCDPDYYKNVDMVLEISEEC